MKKRHSEGNPFEDSLAVAAFFFDQMTGFNRDLAATLGAYVRDLEREGFTREEAFKLAQGWQTEWLRRLFNPAVQE